MIPKPNVGIFFFGLSIMLLLSTFAAAEETSCFYCGMNKSHYGHSWMVVRYDEHTKGEFCSLHCAAIDMILHTEKPVKTILVGDYYTKKLIDADGAHWVIGGSKAGVMTTRAKWAFESQEAAERYTLEYGGEPATLETAIKAAFQDMYDDMMMIQKRRAEVRMRKLHDNK